MNATKERKLAAAGVKYQERKIVDTGYGMWKLRKRGIVTWPVTHSCGMRTQASRRDQAPTVRFIFVAGNTISVGVESNRVYRELGRVGILLGTLKITYLFPLLFFHFIITTFKFSNFYKLDTFISNFRVKHIPRITDSSISILRSNWALLLSFSIHATSFYKYIYIRITTVEQFYYPNSFLSTCKGSSPNFLHLFEFIILPPPSLLKRVFLRSKRADAANRIFRRLEKESVRLMLRPLSLSLSLCVYAPTARCA